MKYVIIILIVAVVVVVLLASQRSGPRITTIEHRREIDETDERKDGDA